MYIYKIIMVLVLIISLLGSSTKVIAQPLEINPELSLKQQVDVFSKQLPNIKTYALIIIKSKWDKSQFYYFDKLVERESEWKNTAQNPKSTAYGIGQFLNSTWKIVGCVKTSNEYKQIDCMIDYIEGRYKTPQRALQFHYKNNYY